jgi:hypothetical protein
VTFWGTGTKTQEEKLNNKTENKVNGKLNLHPFDDADIISDYIPSNERTADWNGCGGKRSWPN